MRLKFVLAALSCLALQAGNYGGTVTITTSGTAVALSTGSPVPPSSCITITVAALSTNSGTVFIGASNVSAANKIGLIVTSTSPAYYAPAASNALYVPSTIYVDSTSSGDKVTYTCLR